jgi:hypothetical protein
MIRANPMGKGLPLIPPGHPRMTLGPFDVPILPMARGGIRTEGSTVNTLGKLLKRGGKKRGGRRRM